LSSRRPCLASKEGTSTAACKMSVSTLNPHLVHSVSLHDVRRRALDDMHSRSARFRVEGQ
jgi:hypothetical protein